MKPGDLFNAKVGTVSVTIGELKGNPPQLRWMVTHHERIKGECGSRRRVLRADQIGGDRRTYQIKKEFTEKCGYSIWKLVTGHR